VLAAARRLAVVLAVVVGVTGLISALTGLLAGSSLTRAMSVGFYLVGCFLIVMGFFSGVRGPVRPRGKEEDAPPLAASFGVGVFWSGVRTATAGERYDALTSAWLFLLLGVGLVIAGVLVDSRVGFT
jgi:uncharacterized membrane protein HdeD (DUF308 family)